MDRSGRFMRECDSPECETSVACLAKVKVAVVRMGKLSPHMYQSFFSMLSAIRCVRVADIAGLRLPQYHSKSSVFNLPLARGGFDLEYVPDLVPSAWGGLFASKKAAAVFALVHARTQSPEELAEIMEDFKALQREYPQSKCLLINPTDEQMQAQDLDSNIMKHVRFIPMTHSDSTRRVVMVLVHEMLAGFVQGVHQMMTLPEARTSLSLTTPYDPHHVAGAARVPVGQGAPSASGSAPPHSHPGLPGSSSFTERDSKARRDERHAARLLKWFGDICLQVSDFKSAKQYYKAAITALEKLGDTLWEGAALECLACAVFFYRVSFFAGNATAEPPLAQNSEYSSDEAWMMDTVDKYTEALARYEQVGCAPLYVEAGIRLTTLLILLNQSRQQIVNIIFAVQAQSAGLHDRNLVLMRLAKHCIAVGCRRRAVLLLRLAGQHAEARENLSHALAAYVPALRLTSVPLTLDGGRFRFSSAEGTPADGQQQQAAPAAAAPAATPAASASPKSVPAAKPAPQDLSQPSEGEGEAGANPLSAVAGAKESRLVRGQRASLSCALPGGEDEGGKPSLPPTHPRPRGRPVPAEDGVANEDEDDSVGFSRQASASVILGKVNFSLSTSVVSAIAKNVGQSASRNSSLYDIVVEGLNHSTGGYGGQGGQGGQYYRNFSEFFVGSGGSGGGGAYRRSHRDIEDPHWSDRVGVGTSKGWDVVQFIILKDLINLTQKVAKTMGNSVLCNQLSLHTISAYAHIADTNFLIKILHGLAEAQGIGSHPSLANRAAPAPPSGSNLKTSLDDTACPLLSPTFATKVQVLPLPSYLAPVMDDVQQGRGRSVFSFNPYLKKAAAATMWVVGEVAQVEITLSSPVPLDLAAASVGVRVAGKLLSGAATTGLATGRVLSKRDVAIPANGSVSPVVGVQPSHAGTISITHVEITLEVEKRGITPMVIPVLPPVSVPVSQKLPLVMMSLKGARDHLVELHLLSGQTVFLTLVLTNAGGMAINQLKIELPSGAGYSVVCEAEQVERILPLRQGQSAEIEIAVTGRSASLPGSSYHLIYPNRPADFSVPAVASPPQPVFPTGAPATSSRRSATASALGLSAAPTLRHSAAPPPTSPPSRGGSGGGRSLGTPLRKLADTVPIYTPVLREGCESAAAAPAGGAASPAVAEGGEEAEVGLGFVSRAVSPRHRRAPPVFSAEPPKPKKKKKAAPPADGGVGEADKGESPPQRMADFFVSPLKPNPGGGGGGGSALGSSAIRLLTERAKQEAADAERTGLPMTESITVETPYTWVQDHGSPQDLGKCGRGYSDLFASTVGSDAGALSPRSPRDPTQQQGVPSITTAHSGNLEKFKETAAKVGKKACGSASLTTPTPQQGLLGAAPGGSTALGGGGAAGKPPTGKPEGGAGVEVRNVFAEVTYAAPSAAAKAQQQPQGASESSPRFAGVGAGPSIQQVDDIKLVYGQHTGGDEKMTLFSSEEFDTIEGRWDTYVTPLRRSKLPLCTTVTEGLICVGVSLTECNRFYHVKVLNKSKRIFNLLNSPYRKNVLREGGLITPFILPRGLNAPKDARVVEGCPEEYQPAQMKIPILPAATPTSILLPLLQFVSETRPEYLLRGDSRPTEEEFASAQQSLLNSIYIPWVTYASGKPTEGVVPVSCFAGCDVDVRQKHPTTPPVTSPQDRAIRAQLSPPSVVLDPFMGGGPRQTSLGKPRKTDNIYLRRKGSFVADIATVGSCGTHKILTSPRCQPQNGELYYARTCDGDCLSLQLTVSPEGKAGGGSVVCPEAARLKGDAGAGGFQSQVSVRSSTFRKAECLVLPLRQSQMCTIRPVCTASHVVTCSGHVDVHIGFAQHATKEGSITPAFLAESVFVEGSTKGRLELGDGSFKFALALHSPGVTLLQVRVLSHSAVGPVAHVHTFPLRCLHRDPAEISRNVVDSFKAAGVASRV